ncbi:hypothetical protein A3C39_02210 [Candidatus Saccharibacteria bacterium RIFCSPHIGHO2_02_FULL_46_12]|nr:MAG: hypothetical protein A3C39_02210 [Candidatus Saccharibacteria bacterium RIFCSPHIGHO2_02_FULL_46_12]
MRLPSGLIMEREMIEDAAQRIASGTLGLDSMTSVARLSPIDGVHGYVIEASTGARTDMRRTFAGRAFALDMMLKESEEYPERYDEIDIALLQSYSDETFRI